MRSLVTGGAGFIGSNLVDALVERGDEVGVVDDLSTGSRENLDAAISGGAELIECDVRDRERIVAEFARVKPELVFHLAAQVDVRKSIVDPAFDASINLIGTANVLDAARQDGARVVFASTGGAIYGEGEDRRLPFAESDECFPEAPYGQSKFAAEGYCALFRRLYGLAATVLRLGNVYGPRQDPLGEAGVVAIFCNQVIEGGRPTVYGDGRQTRDYIYVTDVVDAMVRAADAGTGGVLNVGTGVETSALDLAAGMGRVAERDDFDPQMAPARKGEVQRTVLDVSLAARELAWEPKVEIFDEGLRRTLEWARGAAGQG